MYSVFLILLKDFKTHIKVIQHKHEIFEIMMLENIKITNYNNVIKYIFTVYK